MSYVRKVHSRHLESLLAGLFRTRIDALARDPCGGRHLALPVPYPGHRQVAVSGFCTLSRGDDDSDAAIGNQAAIEQVERLNDIARVQVILHRQRLAHLCPRIHLRPLALRDGNRSQAVRWSSQTDAYVVLPPEHSWD